MKIITFTCFQLFPIYVSILTKGLIGKKHVAPESVYKFDYERSADQYNQDQIGRNITFMKQFVREFLNQKDDR